MSPRRKPSNPKLKLLGVIAATSLLGGCATSLQPAQFAAAVPQMRPEVFFAGETRSSGVLEAASGAPSQRLRVQGHGRRLPDGRLELVQAVTMGDRAPTMRTWVMTPQGPHDYTATLTDASGPVRAQAYGDLFHLTYRLKNVPLGSMEQWLYLQSDGRTVVNEAVVRVAGIAVRRLSERITREAP